MNQQEHERDWYIASLVAERTAKLWVLDAEGTVQAWPKDMAEAEMMLLCFPGGSIVVRS